VPFAVLTIGRSRRLSRLMQALIAVAGASSAAAGADGSLRLIL
jgi:hypothetical protein